MKLVGIPSWILFIIISACSSNDFCFLIGSNAVSLHDVVNNDLAIIAGWLNVNKSKK